MPRSILALLAAAALAVPACGTTVSLSRQASAGGGPTGLNGSGDLSGSNGSAGSAAGAPSGSAAAGDTAARGTGGALGGPTAADATTQPGAAPVLSGTSPAAPGPLAATGRGWDAKVIHIGVTTQKDAETVYKSAGFAGIDIGDTTAQANAVTHYVNTHGGLLGRQIAIDFQDVPTLLSSENPDQYANQVCTHYAQDRPVVAVINIVTTMDVPNFRACLAKAGIPLFSAADTAVDEAVERPLIPFFYSIVAPAWDELAPLLVQRLQAQGWFGGWNANAGTPSPATPTKIGLLVVDDPIGAQIEKILQGALANAGYRNVVSFAYTYPGNNIQPAILYFAGHGVTHVISDDIELAAFQTSAVSQHYIPRYGITTYNDPGTNLTRVAPASEQVGDMGIGWGPTYDVTDAADPGTTGPGESRCLSLMAAGGVTYSDRLAKAFALSLCDGMFLAVDGAAAAGDLHAAGIYNGVLRIAPTFSPAFSFATGLRSGRAFVPGAARDLVWNASRGTFQYASSTNYSF